MALNSTDNFTLQGWMVTELKLQGGDLIAFALVHQFAQSNAGIYKGNTRYLSDWTGWSERTSRAHLLALQQRGLIVEVRGRADNSPFCYYKLGPAFPESLKSTPQKLQGDPAKISKSTPQNLPKAPRKNCRENINVEEYTSVFIPPTPPEVADYVRKFGMADPDGFAIYYVEQMNNNGWTYGKKATPVKNWKNNVHQWVKYHKNEDFSHLKPSSSTPTPKAPAPSALNPDTYHKIFD